MGATEAKITREIRLYLLRHPLKPFFMKVYGNGMQRSGIPDYLMCYRGRFVALEVKKEDGGRVSAIQKSCIKEIKGCEGIAEVVRSVDEVMKILAKIDACLEP